MDWNDSDIMDLPDALVGSPQMDLSGGHVPSSSIGGGVEGLLNVPSSTTASHSSSIHGSEPNLTGLGLSDTDIAHMDNSSMNLDVLDWLDVIIPNSTGMTPLSATAPMSFPSDPILTPKPQDVLDIFNMEESDFQTPTDLQSGMNWDKVAETSKS